MKQLQEHLLKLGYGLPKYGADGDFGSETEEAVRAFQKAEGLEVDGKYGEKSHAALMDALLADDEAPEPPAQPEGSGEGNDAEKPVGSHVVIVSEGGKVNIRVGNGTQYGRITQLAPGTTLDYVATAPERLERRCGQCARWVGVRGVQQGDPGVKQSTSFLLIREEWHIQEAR